jgi:predicted small integral membrane protein
LVADRGAPQTGASSRIDRSALARRTRNIAVWSIAFFVGAVPIAIIGGAPEREADGAPGIGGTLAMLFWLLGVLAGAWAFVLAFRHWNDLPPGIRWLASLPLLVVLFLVALSLLVTVITAPPLGTAG